MVPALNIQGNDIGGASGPIFSVFQIHGGRRNEGQVLVDGLSMGFQGMGVSFYVPEVGTAQEVTFSLSGGLGEAPTGGPQMNIVPRAGGNTFSGSLFVTGANGAMQGDNITQEIRDAGLTGRNELKKLWEVNPALGGPIRRDRLWFYGRSVTRAIASSLPACSRTGTRGILRSGPTIRIRVVKPSTTVRGRTGRCV